MSQVKKASETESVSVSYVEHTATSISEEFRGAYDALSIQR